MLVESLFFLGCFFLLLVYSLWDGNYEDGVLEFSGVFRGNRVVFYGIVGILF